MKQRHTKSIQLSVGPKNFSDSFEAFTISGIYQGNVIDVGKTSVT